MRIEELLEREPFKILLEQTLLNYWDKTESKEILFSWEKNNSLIPWYGNTRLNFFSYGVKQQEKYENIIREYSYSTNAIRCLLQFVYVKIATYPSLVKYFSNIVFYTSDSFDSSREIIILGGRNKIRLIDFEHSSCSVILKKGYPQRGYNNELLLRKSLARNLTPEIYSTSSQYCWFVEEYIVGTPTNRMNKIKQTKFRTQAIEDLAIHVHKKEFEERPVVEYINELCAQITEKAKECSVISRIFNERCTNLFDTELVGYTMTHGDFQDANILVSNRIYIIDWECASKRTQFYDIATLISGIRICGNKVNSWIKALDKFVDSPVLLKDLILPIKSEKSLMAHAAVWCLEEILFNLDEYSENVLHNPKEKHSRLALDMQMSLDYLTKRVR